MAGTTDGLGQRSLALLDLQPAQIPAVKLDQVKRRACRRQRAKLKRGKVGLVVHNCLAADQA